MNASTTNTVAPTNNSGFPPEPSEAHQRADGFERRYRDAAIAGLRLLQQVLSQGAIQATTADVLDVMTDCGAHEGVTVEEIDAICESLNK